MLHGISPSTFGICCLIALSLGISGCQTFPPAPKPKQSTSLRASPTAQPVRPTRFQLAGKIGIRVYQSNGQRQAGSATYQWQQQGERFSIELAGILGLGRTQIDYNGQQATLTRAGGTTLTANSPEDLLKQATEGWTAPLRLLPDWVHGLPQATDAVVTRDALGRAQSIAEQGWQATLIYGDQTNLPTRLLIKRPSPYQPERWDEVTLIIQQREISP